MDSDPRIKYGAGFVRVTGKTGFQPVCAGRDACATGVMRNTLYDIPLGPSRIAVRYRLFKGERLAQNLDFWFNQIIPSLS